MPRTNVAHAVQNDESSGGRLVATDGRVLPLSGAKLSADARGGIARVLLEQTFQNPYDEALSVTYLLPLPADGAVSAFAFRVGQRRIVGEMDARSKARERYQQALCEGRSAALVEQDRSSLFTQEIGNIPPRSQIVAEVTVDQKLAWVTEGAWEWRFPTTVAPRYMGAPGRVADAARLTVEVADKPLPVRMTLDLAIRDAVPQGSKAESPSHDLRLATDLGGTRASFRSEDGVPLDRDVVVRWPVATPQVGLSLDGFRALQAKATSSSAYGLMTVVPPRPDSKPEPVARDLILLIDTSGSMSGEPLQHVKRVVSALIGSLGAKDRLEMIEFSNSPSRWTNKPVEATEKNRSAALKWVKGLQAGGGTEMLSGVMEALAPLRPDAQRQVVVLTDGDIGFEAEVVGRILNSLPKGCRLHAVGVGSAVNRSLTAPVARAGRGVELVVGLGEDPERAVRRLLARTEAPLVTDLALAGSALLEAAPERLPDLFAASPVLLGLKLKPEGGRLEVSGRTAKGPWTTTLEVRPQDFGQGNAAAATLFAREKVEDLETRTAAGERHEQVIEKLGLDFQIATRLTSWIAVSDLVDVDPRKATRHETMPHELPDGMSAEGLGLRGGAATTEAFAGMEMDDELAAPAQAQAEVPARLRQMAMGSAAPSKKLGIMEKAKDLLEDVKEAFKSTDRPAKTPVAHRPPAAPPVFEPAEEEAGEAFDKTPEPAPAAPAAPGARPAPKTEAAKGAAARTLKGRLTLRRGGELVLEIEIAEGIEWEPGGTVRIEWADGTVLEATIVEPMTTAPASLPAGTRARLVLATKADGPVENPWRVTLACRGEPLEIRIG